MHRIDADDADGLFKTAPAPATVVTPQWANDVQENLARLIEAFGIALSKGDYDQLTDAFASVGLPGRAAITDLDAVARSGFYSSSAGATGRPDGVAGGKVISIYDAVSESDGLQLFVEDAADVVWLRRWDGEAWSTWAAIAGLASGVEATGRWRRHADGVIEQYGYYAGGSANPYITFPIEFPEACDNIVVTAISTTNSTPSGSQGGVNYASPAAAATTLGFSVWCSADDGGPDTNQPSTTVPFYWRALGR